MSKASMSNQVGPNAYELICKILTDKSSIIIIICTFTIWF